MRTIVLATDFSRNATNAGYYAVELAKFFSARLVLLNAFTLPENDYSSITPKELREIIEKRCLYKLNKLKEQLTEQDHLSAIETVALEGTVEAGIRTTVKEFNAGLVVMGVSGDVGFINEFVLKNTSIEAAKQNDTYTLLVPEGARYRKVHKLALACDLNHTRETVIPYVAKYFCGIFEAELEIVSVNAKGESLSKEKENSVVFLDHTLSAVKHKVTLIKGASPKRELRNYFKNSDSDIIMVMPRKHNFLYYLFDQSVTNNLAGKINTPVLILH